MLLVTQTSSSCSVRAALIAHLAEQHTPHPPTSCPAPFAQFEVPARGEQSHAAPDLLARQCDVLSSLGDIFHVHRIWGFVFLRKMKNTKIKNICRLSTEKENTSEVRMLHFKLVK